MSRPRPHLALAFGLLAASTAAVLVRVAQSEGMSSVVLTTGRLAIATILISPLVLARHRHEFAKLKALDWILAVFCGAILGAHFYTWIVSLEYTSLIASVVLVSTAPIFLNLLSYPLLRERVTLAVSLGTLVAFGGGIVVALSGREDEAASGSWPLLGNGLALAGALAFALYLIIGRRLRDKVQFLPYIWVVYGSAALITGVIAAFAGESFLGHTPRAYGALLALGLVPQLIGHSSFNYALRHLPAAYVGLVTRLEAVGSTILGVIILHEIPTVTAVVGSLIILAGVTTATWKPVKRPVP